eukprot:TRINITY_DN18499_c0_g1_i1.p1 TRINITY_DN18499_c0_g1~~TRINITY_DN18499_c0_g1_i1.p1  ORF type:complete len:130 (+),score=21.43 TRINITY_DN18499_c0_g1_i1:716-1105(+)
MPKGVQVRDSKRKPPNLTHSQHTKKTSHTTTSHTTTTHTHTHAHHTTLLSHTTSIRMEGFCFIGKSFGITTCYVNLEHRLMGGDVVCLGTCLLYTSDAADEEDSVDLGGRRIIKKKKKIEQRRRHRNDK